MNAPVISHQSQFTWLTGANGPHATALAARILIEMLRAATFSPLFSFMQNMVHLHAHVRMSSALCQSPFSHLNCEFFQISHGDSSGLTPHLYSAHGRHEL